MIFVTGGIEKCQHANTDQNVCDACRAVADDKCANCKTRKIDGVWVGEGGAWAYVHGGGVPWCRLCMAREQLKHGVRRADTGAEARNSRPDLRRPNG